MKMFIRRPQQRLSECLFLSFQRDFLSIELVEGQVRLTFDLGSGALVLTSSRKYNTGTWYKITLQRNKRKGTRWPGGVATPLFALGLIVAATGYLSIMAADLSSEKEVLEAESPGTASDLNRSDFDPIYVGGLPASRPIRYLGLRMGACLHLSASAPTRLSAC